MQKDYNHKKIENFVQKYWEEKKTFEVTENSEKEKYYCLSMLPYPSGDLHMGHVRNYILGDAVARYQRMLGKNVLHPIGWDAFGLPAEHAAIKNNTSPEKWTLQCIQNMKQQLKSLGCSYDWNREIITCHPNYYRWDQWFFIQLYNKNIAYKKKSTVNWCSKDQTVLANEQVINNSCWRCNSRIKKKIIPQWFIKITNYADRLLNDIQTLENWPKKVKIMQKNWIGKSKGIEVELSIYNYSKKIKIYINNIATFMGGTFVIISSDHILLKSVKSSNYDLYTFIHKCQTEKNSETNIKQNHQKGIFTSLFAIHPISQKKLPIWICNFFFIPDSSNNAILSVPVYSKDQWDFAKKYNLPILHVLKDSKGNFINFKQKKLMQTSTLCNSGQFNGLKFCDGSKKISQFLISNHIGKNIIHYRLKDWCISRQRYWGAPIPIIKNNKNEIFTVSENELPVILPEKNTDQLVDSLKNYANWINIYYKKNRFTRETDTFDTFIQSSWYLYRYTCPHYIHGMLNTNAVNYWLPVDLYIGGVEHATMHLLYLRFYHKLFKDMNLVNSNEPIKKLLCQGMVLSDTFYYISSSGSQIWTTPVNNNFKRNENNQIVNAVDSLGHKLIHTGMHKMSKSKNNGVHPNNIIRKYGADTLRLFIVFAAPPEASLEWTEKGIQGAYRFIKKIWNMTFDYVEKNKNNKLKETSENNHESSNLILQTQKIIIKITENFENKYKFNTVVALIMKLTNYLRNAIKNNKCNRSITKKILMIIIRLLYPFTPHVCFILWRELKGSKDIDYAEWPKINSDVIKKKKKIIVQVNGKFKKVMIFKFKSNEKYIKEKIFKSIIIKNSLKNKKIKKIIYIKNKLINFVLNE
ncbi:leucyl-tRNA synthetase [Wigglesworthia glossinidia endosymbiont of Glossina morsitans morsitans (Yale colony)]|uniref:Leucine--tRNA ligase n=1 Tax=Wigglesworthia glossinidia endosymbiont of Glossina morsitans morsitans (Yale colony) TaxID=1142511 RepID=H6Q5E6_WIGGL|nr:leucine--tRNA ligase [Wigglesworthia glossinidia]AFA41429.1 leucyl-tRNA synthetase [Wigglesworthia glossinidia endosymbiont of Glossina morsitans morsitans (Yale colony)]